MPFACDKLSKLSMMSQQPLHLSKLPTLNISPGAEHEEGGEWGMFVLVRENSSLH